MKQLLLELIQARKVVNMRAIHKHFSVNPANEEDRIKVWRIGQGVAELYREKFIDIGTATGERVCYAV